MPNKKKNAEPALADLRASKEVLRLKLLLDELEAFDLKKFRLSLGLSQDRLAALVELPLRTVTRWEHKKMQPRITSLRKMVDKLLLK